MEIWHRIGFNQQADLESKLTTMGIRMRQVPLIGDRYLVVFDIEEADTSWPLVSSLLQYQNVSDVAETTFSREDILAAEWVRIRPTFEQGYPQPKDSWLDNPLSLSGRCVCCGAGYRQEAPYRLSSEPRMGKHHYLSLYWTYSLFATVEVVSKLREQHIRGFETQEAILHRTGAPSHVVEQVMASGLALPGLVQQNELRSLTCSCCGIGKYVYHNRGYMMFLRDALPTDLDIVQTSEWFGNGQLAFREFLTSSRVAKLILQHNWRGVALKPLKLV